MLVVKGKEPFNAEPEVSALVEFKYTPDDLVYCRNHGPVLELEEREFNVTVNGAVDTIISLSIHDLRTQFPKVKVVAALQVGPLCMTCPLAILTMKSAQVIAERKWALSRKCMG